MNVPLRRSLLGRLLAALCCVAFISVAGLGLAAYMSERSALRQQIYAQLIIIADFKKGFTALWLAERRADTQLLASNKLNQEHFSDLLSPATSSEEKASLLDSLVDSMHLLQQSRPGYSQIVMADVHGVIRAATDPTLIGQSIADDEAFIHTMAAPDGQHTQDLYLHPETGRPEMKFGHVMHAATANDVEPQPAVLGAVILTVDAEQSLFRLIDLGPGLGSTGETMLVRSEGDTTVFLNNTRFAPEAALNLRLRQGTPEAYLATLAANAVEGIQQATDYRGQEVLAAIRYIPQLQWGLVVKIDDNEILAPVYRLTFRLVMVAGVVIVLAVLVSWALARTLIKPLTQLVRATQAVASGDLRTPIAVQRQDELGALAGAFREMVTALDQRQRQLEAAHAEVAAFAEKNVELVQQLRELNASLEEKVAERTQELAAANARLRELDRLKSKFVSNVSHELRSPITSLRGFLELMKINPAKQEQYLALMNAQVDLLGRYIEEILELSRLEQQREHLVFAPLDFNPLVASVVATYQPQAEAAGLRLIFRPDPGPLQVRGNEEELAHLVVNLVANAVNYTPEGSITVITQADPGGVQFVVQDTGIGIPDEDLPHIFERFYRGQNAIQSQIRGTGLGLGIVKEIVQLHGGTIQVDSQVGRGTIFRVWLPSDPGPARRRQSMAAPTVDLKPGD